MKKKLKGILLFLAIVCLSVAFVSPVSGQVYISEMARPYLIKHNIDGSVDVLNYIETQCAKYNFSVEEWDTKDHNFLWTFFRDHSYFTPGSRVSNSEEWRECKRIDDLRNKLECFNQTDASPNYPSVQEFETVWEQRGALCLSDGTTEKNRKFLLDLFDDPEHVGFKKISNLYGHLACLRNDGVFKIKLNTSPYEIIKTSITDYIVADSGQGRVPNIMFLVTENNEYMSIYLYDPQNWENVYHKEETEAFFADSKPLMPVGGIVPEPPEPEEVYTAEFDPQYVDGIGIKIKKNGKGIGSFKALSKQPGAKYIKDSLYIEDDKVVVKVIIGNGKYKGLQICGEWEKFPPFLNIVGPKKCN
jgi:hypothetical protein